jgi:hypothetical protein
MKLPQCVEEWLQLQLVLLDDAIRLVLLVRHQDLVRESWQAAVVVAQIEPTVVPPAVRRDELGRNVELASACPHLEGAAFGVHRPPYSPLTRLLGEVLRLKEVEPQLPVGLHTQVPLADGRKNGDL